MTNFKIQYIILLFCSIASVTFGQVTNTVTDIVINHLDNIKSLCEMNEIR